MRFRDTFLIVGKRDGSSENKREKGSVDELQAALKGESQMRVRVNGEREVTKSRGKVYGVSS